MKEASIHMSFHSPITDHKIIQNEWDTYILSMNESIDVTMQHFNEVKHADVYIYHI